MLLLIGYHKLPDHNMWPPILLSKQGLIQCLIVRSSVFFRIFIFVITNNLINKTNSGSSFQWLKSQIGDFILVLFLQVQQIHRMILCQGTHGSRRRMNKKRYIKSNSYLVHYRPYQGVKSGKQVASCTKWGLGDNVVLRLMECLTPAVSCHLFMANYFTSFRLFVSLPTLELTICEQVVCSTKIGYANTPSLGINSCKRWNVATLKSAVHSKQKRCVTCRAG